MTDQAYGKLIANDVQDIIGNLGKNRRIDLNDQLGELLTLLQQAGLQHLLTNRIQRQGKDTRLF